MALMRKCDRYGCDSVYNHTAGWSKTQVKDRTKEDGQVVTESYDLCPDCMKQLQCWLNCKGKLKEAE